MENALSSLPNFEAGWVWLVGAGPGDPGLLTLHAVSQAECNDEASADNLNMVQETMTEKEIVEVVERCCSPRSALCNTQRERR